MSNRGKSGLCDARAIPLLSLFLSLSIRLTTDVPENAALKHVVAEMAAYFIDVAAIVNVVAGNMIRSSH